MKIFLGVLAGIFALGTIGEKYKPAATRMAICFCVSVAAIAIIEIL